MESASEPPGFPQPSGEPPAGVEPPAGSEPGATEPPPGEPSPLEAFSRELPDAELPGTELPPVGEPTTERPPAEPPSFETPSAPPTRVPAGLNITSSAFQQGKTVPKEHTGDGEDVSPPLAWSGLPAGTKQLALICDDPDAPRDEPWVHWVIYAIPPQTAGLPEGVPRTERLENPPGALQGRNSWPTDNIGYRGPAPPPKDDAHRYFFKLYALDTALKLAPGLSKDELLAAIKGHVLAEGQLLGTYDR
jgi:Raf kinase inhibitor-like YbhB/YbcL family protein